MTFPSIPGRAPVSVQIHHTIPWELFGGREGNLDPHALVELFRGMGGGEAHFNFDSPDNFQRLPSNALPGGSAAHFGSHPGWTNAVSDHMDNILAEVRRDHAAVLAVAEGPLDTPARAAARDTMRGVLSNTMREMVDDLRFKASNFMDDTLSGGNRMLLNGRDLAYLKTTDTWRDATPAERARAVSRSPSELIARHNAAVAGRELTPERALEKKVLTDLGDGVLGQTDGSLHSRNAIRGLISEAARQGVNLEATDAKAFLHTLENNFDNAVSGLTSQIDNLQTQINNAPDALKPTLMAQRDALVGERYAAQALQTIGQGDDVMPMNHVRSTVGDIIDNGRMGRPATAALKFLGKRVLLKLIPVVNIFSTAYDIYDFGSFIYENHEAIGRGIVSAAQSLYNYTTGTLFNAASWTKKRDVLVIGMQQNDMQVVIVQGTRGRNPTPTTYIYVFDSAGLSADSSAPAQGQMDLAARVAGVQQELIKRFDPEPELPIDPSGRRSGGGSSGGNATRNADGTITVETFEEAPVAGTAEGDLSLRRTRSVFVGPTAISPEEVRMDARIEIGLDSPFTPTAFQITMGQIGGILGSSLGTLLRIENPWAAFAVNTTLGALGSNIGLALSSPNYSLTDAFADLPDTIKDAGLGAISAFLFGQLVDELGIDGFAGGVVSSAGGAAISQIATNLQIIEAARLAEVATDVTWSTGVDMAMATAAAGFIGTWLASRVIQFDSFEGQTGASLGASFGVLAGVEIGLSTGVTFGGPIGALVGAFVGFIFGGLIGSLFAGTPRSGADIYWNERTQSFAAAGGWARNTLDNNATASAARSLASGAADILNSVIALSGSRVIDGAQVRAGSYGTDGKNFVYRTVNPAGRSINLVTIRQADHVIRYGALYALSDLIPRLAGGDVFVKRALAATLARADIDTTTLPTAEPQVIANLIAAVELSRKFDVQALLGNLVLAREFSNFWQQGELARFIMTNEPDSAMALTWAATIAAAMDLGLHRRGATDWTGGWTVFLDEANDGKINGSSFAASNLDVAVGGPDNERMFGFFDGDGNSLGVLGDTIDSEAKDSIHGTDVADNITVTGATLDTSGLYINNEPAGLGLHTIDVAALIYGEGGDDIVVAGDLGNDVFGGEDNDTLVGGKLDDWLFGEEGDDRLFAGPVTNYWLSDSDAAAVAGALNLAGNGDMLDGGDGNDLLYGTRGSDWLRGGDGSDTLRGGAGADIIDGGMGNDRGPNGEARLLGGSGTDQYVFTYGDGADVVFDDADAANPGATSDSIYWRIQNIVGNPSLRDWAGTGDYERDGSIKGGEDAIVFGTGITMQDVSMRRSGTEAAPGMDLIIELSFFDEESNQRLATGDSLLIKDWFESTRRVEWLRFANGEDLRIGDLTSYIAGTGASDIIIGTYGPDFIYGSTGNDTLFGLSGDDFGYGGEGNDLVAGDEDNDFVSGGLGNDNVIGGLGNDTVFGDSGNDTVNGGLGADLVIGGRGDDFIVGGEGNDIFRYQRGDGRDELLDGYVDNWELVWQNDTYVNGYSVDSSGHVTKNGVTYFDGTRWDGTFDYVDSTHTLRRHLGPVGGTLASNSGVDFLEFGAGIDIQDLMLRRTGGNLEIAITSENDGTPFDAASDRINLRDWYLTGTPVENFVFVATGIHNLTGMSIQGLGTDSGEVLTGTVGVDWITGNGGNDTINGDTGNDLLSGNTGADTIRGGGGDDIIWGGAGDDLLEGGAGNDVIIGGTGIDVVSYAGAVSPNNAVRAFLLAPHTNSREARGDFYVGLEGIEGSSGADKLGGDGQGNIMRGLGGNDTLYGGAGNDNYEIDASNGQDTIFDAPFTTEEIINASGVFNSVEYTATWTHLGPMNGGRAYRLVVTRNGSGEEVYRSRDGIDYLYGINTSQTRPMPAATSWASANGQWAAALGVTRTGNAQQTVRELFSTGDGGMDSIDFGGNIGLSDLTFTRLNGNADLRITYASNQFVTITGQSTPERAIEQMTLRDGLAVDLTRVVIVGETASANGDLVMGDANANTLEGLAGDDVISGGAGVDTLRGGDGDDVLEGGAGADTLDGGTDSITNNVPIDPEDPYAYGDTIRYVRSNAAVTIDLAARSASGGHAASDVIVLGASTFASIENVVGSEGFNDTLRGDARANRLGGLGGNDTLDGRAGDDLLVGGAGNDTISGGDGADGMSGDAGDDTLNGGNGADMLAGGDGVDIMNGDAGDDILSGGEGNDTLRGGADDDIVGGDGGNDTLYGDAGVDRIGGGDGNDSLDGGDGDDNLAGEAGDDTLIGGAGNDELFGGGGNDNLAGGADNDTLAGGEGNDQLAGDAGDDLYRFSANHGNDTIVDASGSNSLEFTDVTAEQLWLTRSGNDLRFGVIGGTTFVTLQGYYAPSNPTLAQSVTVGVRTLDLSLAGSLIQAMTSNSLSTPAAMPESLLPLVEAHWNGDIGFGPVVGNQILTTDEDTQLSGSVDATDLDSNITGYAQGLAPARGTLNLNTTAGSWTYTPDANAFGADSFTIVVTDAEGNTATQNVAVTINSVNDAPAAINVTGLVASIDERDRPISGSSPPGTIVLATLGVSDPDVGDTGDFASHTYTLDNANFEVVRVGTEDQLRLRSGVALDYEQGTSVSVNVTARDRNGTGLAVTRGFTFVVNNRDDYFYGGTGNDTITGTAGRNLIYGLDGNDTLTGAGANDTLSGGDGDDLLQGGLGNDSLNGDAGADSFRFGPNSGADTVVDTAGNNAIQFTDVTTGQLWITRSGNDLRIGVIGGTSIVTVQGFYASSGATLMRSIETAGLLLHLAGAQALITAMTAASVSTPAVMPANVAAMLNNFWFPPGAAPPMVVDQTHTTAEDTPFSGNAAAFDAENNITGYSIVTGPTRGAVNLNATTGAWTYSPNANAFGADGFSIRVTDATGNTAIQNVVMNLTSMNDAPTTINASGLISSIDERDRPITGAGSPAIVLATLTVSDPDTGDTGDYASHSYSVNDARFEVVGGQLRLRAGVAFDYEAETSVSVNVTATDRNGAGLSVTRGFTFAVNNRDDYFYGTASNDTITGTAGQNLIYGRGGNDTLTGAGANDVLDGEDGNDTLYGLGGIDTLYGQIGDDILDGGAGNDTLRGGDGTDTLRGGDGDDAVYGDSGLDMLYGGIGNDTLEGGAHDDYLEGGDGNDTLRGGTENDMMIGGLGGDRFNGGAGTDTVSYASAAAGVTLSLASGTGTGGEAAGDVFEDAIERIIGSGNNDNITGSAGDDYIEGGGGNDTILGGAGADTLIGGAGDDTIDAQAGNDILDGGLGSDILIGGDDDDTYRLDASSGTDEIRNFHQNAADIDVVGYAGVPRENLWFERSGNDLIVTAVGTTTRTTITGWYAPGSVVDRANYQVKFFQTGQWETSNINAEALVTLMAGYTRPTTVAAFDALHANPTFQANWQAGWNLNAPPTLGNIAAQTVNEDGSLTISLAVDDIITPNEGLTVTATRVNPSTGNPETTMLGSPSVQRDSAGNYSLVINTLSNVSGQGAIRVTVTDPGNLSVSQTFLVNVTPVADQPGISGPVLTAGPVAPSALVSFDAGSLGLTLDAWLNDTDGSETLDIRISGATGGLSFNQGTDLTGGVWSFTRSQLAGLRLQAPPTRGDAVALTMTVVAREAANGNTWTRTATLNFDPNARPTGISEDRTLSFSEGVANGTGLAWFTRTDPDNDSASYSIVDSAGGRYSVRSDGLLQAGATPTDYESATSHNIVVRVTDSNGLSFDRAFTVGVQNVNEAPTALNADRTLSFNEGYANGTGLAWFTGADPENNIASYSIVDSAGGRYNVRSDGLLQAGATPTDVESATSHNIVVRVTDSGGLSFDRTFTVGVQNVNEAPTALNADRTLSFNEGYANGTGLAWFTGADPENNIAGYSIVDSAGGRFSVRSDGLLQAGATPTDYESATSHNIVVRVTDSNGLSFDRTFTVGVQNVNEAPTSLSPDRPLSFVENAANGTGLAWFTSTDPENNGLTYNIVSGHDAGGRYFVRSDGLLQAGATPTDFETGTSYNIRVRVTDSLGLSQELPFTVNVLNGNDAPIVHADTIRAVESNPAPGALYDLNEIGNAQARVSGSDQDPGTSLRFELENAGSSIFAVDAVTGFVSISARLDYEATSSYNLRVRAWDGGAVGSGLASAWQNITVNVDNVPERPTIGWVQDSNTTTSDWYIGSLTSTDPDGGPVTYEITQAYYHVDQYEYHAGMQQSYTYYEQNCLSYMAVNSAGRVEHLGSFPNSMWGEYWDWQVETISSSGTFFARARDSGGLLSDPIRITFGWYTGWQAPVVFDLDGDGVELIEARDSTTRFALNENGNTVRNGWVGADDAFLALDRDGDGLISHGAEISFVKDLEHAASDLEGLAAFDTNGNLSLDAGDERFVEFRVWQDRNQDGVSQQDELRSLNDAGIQSLSLLRTLSDSPASQRGNAISATTEFVRTDGSRGQAADVALQYVTYVSEVVEETPIDPHGQGEVDIGGVDRSATAPPAASTGQTRHRPIASAPVAVDPIRDPVEPRPLREQVAEGASARQRPWRVADMRYDEPRITVDEWSPEPADRAPAALHASLSSITRRRLQMIDAMATFEPEAGAELALRPLRHVDARTLALLTAVPRTGSMA